MRSTRLLVALLVVLSTAGVWVGGAAAAPKDVVYRPMEVTPEMLDGPVDYDSLPSDVGIAADGASASSSGGGASTTAAAVGDVKFFLALDTVNGYYFKPFQLRAIGEHGEIWVATDLSFPDSDPRGTPVITDAQIDYMMAEFDTNIYPTESEVFGEPAPRDGSDSFASLLGLPGDYWTTDGEGRSVILVDNVRDDNYYDPEYPLYVAGFYSPLIQQYTDRNVVTVDAYDWEHRVGTEDSPWWPDGEPGVEHLYEGTFAHEYQHLIHGDLDGDETTWVNEGMSDLAEYLVGYGHPMGHVNAYLEAPDNSLVQWEDQGPINVLRDYGHTYLFHLYLQEQYGTEFVTDLAQSESNGIASVEETMAAHGVEGDFYTLYQDFSTAVAVDGSNAVDDPRYQFASIDLDPNLDVGAGEVGAYGAAYNTISMEGEGPAQSLTVNGVDLLETEWTVVDDGGTPALYSGMGNEVDRFAIIEADLRGVSSPTLTFETNYSIETGWDYGFVQVSTDGGETWTSLENDHTTSVLADPANAYPTVAENLPGFTGSTDGAYVTEEFDLSAYADQEVLVAFRYVTDWAFQEEGWYVRNVAISGTDVDYDGSSAEPFLSLREATEDYVEYQFTFVGIRGSGQADVLQLDMRTFDDGDAQELAAFFESDGRGPNYRAVLFVVSFAPEAESPSVVPYAYDVGFYDHGQRDTKGNVPDGPPGKDQ